MTKCKEMKKSEVRQRYSLVFVFVSGIAFAIVLVCIPSLWSAITNANRKQLLPKTLTLKPGGSSSNCNHFPLAVKDVKDRRPLVSKDIKGESLASLRQALSARTHGQHEKAHKLFQHALALDPHHADALNEFGEFIEDEDIMTADHLYTCALILNPSHSKALVNRERTSRLVEEIDQRNFDRIELKLKELFRVPENNAALQRARLEMYYQHVYHTVAIEGNTLTLSQMRSVMETGMVVPDKSVLEHNEILGMELALAFINSTLLPQMRSVSVPSILQIHRRVLAHNDPLEAGRYRSTQVFVSGYVPPPPTDLLDLMDELDQWLGSEEALTLNPIEFAALAHYKLVYIHPFVDGNGRTARLLMNLILMQAGYPPISIRYGDRHEYYQTLELANQGDVRPFIRFIAANTERTVDEYLLLTGHGGNLTLTGLAGNTLNQSKTIRIKAEESSRQSGRAGKH